MLVEHTYNYDNRKINLQKASRPNLSTHLTRDDDQEVYIGLPVLMTIVRVSILIVIWITIYI